MTMRTNLLATTLCAVAAMFLPALARALPGDEPYREGRDFGLGAIIGDPTGLTGEKWLGRSTALDFGAAWSFENNDTMDLTADHLWYDFGALGTNRHTLALHYGLGGRVRLEDHADDRAGLRIPVGITWFADEGRVGLFMEVAPVLDVAPSSDLSVQGGVGARYFLQ
jgi:hypothetical protein